MNEGNLSGAREKMSRALTMIKEVVDISLPLLKGEQRKEIIAMWEDFLREFIRYLKVRSRETGCNLLGCISFNRIWSR